MLVKKIQIHGYRNFQNFEMELKQFTLIIGENNIGKTNLLNALGLIFGQDVSIHRKRILTQEDFNTKMITKFKNIVFDRLKNKKTNPDDFMDIDSPEVKIELLLTDFNEEQEAVVADWFINKELTEVKVTYRFSKNKELFNRDSKWFISLLDNFNKEVIKKAEDIEIPLSYYRYKIYGGENDAKQIDYYFLNMLKMEFLNALRDAEKELVSQNDYRLLSRILNNKAESGTVFNDLKGEIDKFNKLLSNDKDVKELKSELFKLLKDISLEGDTEESKISFSFNELQTSDLFRRLSLFYGEDLQNIEKNGLGKNNLLYIALILSHLENLEKENQKVFYRLIAIEEPEAHLHPHLQKHLGKQLDKQICKNFIDKSNCKNGKECDKRCKEKQIIVTSHSTHITSYLPLENTSILFSDDSKIKKVKNHYLLAGFDKNAQYKKHIRYLKKYLSATNSTMFFSRKIILVEGISEQILIPKFYEKEYTNSLEKDGITIINVNSVAFKHFLEIISNGFYKKCLVFTDSDKDSEKDEENRADKLKAYYENKDKDLFFISKTEEVTFEVDILKSNNNESAKSIIFDTIKETCPELYRGYYEKHNEKFITNELFELIYCSNPKRNKKSEFAFNLSEKIKSEFNIPKYIKDGFKFLRGDTNGQ